MTQHKVGSRDEWLTARNELLEREQELNRLSNELAEQRRELPWVRVDKEYTVDTDAGTKTLAELFDGRSQLLFYNIMFGPEYTGACPGCTGLADHFDGDAPDGDLLAPYYYQLLDQVPKGRGEVFRRYAATSTRTRRRNHGHEVSR